MKVSCFYINRGRKEIDFRTPTTFTDCDFASGYKFKFESALVAGDTILLNNCTVGGTPITVGNVGSLFTYENYPAANMLYIDGVAVNVAP